MVDATLLPKCSDTGEGATRRSAVNLRSHPPTRFGTNISYLKNNPSQTPNYSCYSNFKQTILDSGSRLPTSFSASSWQAALSGMTPTCGWSSTFQVPSNESQDCRVIPLTASFLAMTVIYYPHTPTLPYAVTPIRINLPLSWIPDTSHPWPQPFSGVLDGGLRR